MADEWDAFPVAPTAAAQNSAPESSITPTTNTPMAAPASNVPTMTVRPEPAAAPAQAASSDPWAAFPVAKAPSTGSDIARGAGRGMIEGSGSILGMPTDLWHMLDRGYQWGMTKAAEKMGMLTPEQGEALRAPITANGENLETSPVSSERINRHLLNAAQSAGADTSAPQTVPGQYAETAASFVPGAVAMGEPTLAGAVRSARNALPAAAGSETAGQLTQGTEAEPYARFAGALVPGAARSAMSSAVRGSGVRPAAVDARQAGYVLPPSAISEKPGIIPSALAGMSGKIKLQQAASETNQGVTNTLAARALGLPDTTALAPNVFQTVRQNAGQFYKAAETAVPDIAADPDFYSAVKDLGGQNGQAAQAFPKIVNNPGIKDMVDELQNSSTHPTGAWIELVKELRNSATQNLKALGDPSKRALGLAQRDAAGAVDDLMERQITAAGNPDAIANYQQARKLIAKSYDIESATNPATGNVSARALGRLAVKGKPLTDELRTIAQTGNAFPKATQAPEGFGHPERWSVLDAAASVGGLASGHPLAAALPFLRPAARGSLLSAPVQNRMAGIGAVPSNPGASLARGVGLGILGSDRTPEDAIEDGPARPGLQ